MEQSKLKPFLRQTLDILFVGLNPATGSSRNEHYFSVNQAFWNQLFDSGLITKNFDKSLADRSIFGNNEYNFNNWQYGITDLIFEIAESNSSIVKSDSAYGKRLINVVIKYKPLTVILLHSKVVKTVIKYLGIQEPYANSGEMGKIIPGSDSFFFNIAFPHGNTIASLEKIERYKEVKSYLVNLKAKLN